MCIMLWLGSRFPDSAPHYVKLAWDGKLKTSSILLAAGLRESPFSLYDCLLSQW